MYICWLGPDFERRRWNFACSMLDSTPPEEQNRWCLILSSWNSEGSDLSGFCCWAFLFAYCSVFLSMIAEASRFEDSPEIKEKKNI